MNKYITRKNICVHLFVLIFSFLMSILTIDGITMNLYCYVILVTSILYLFLMSSYFHFEKDFMKK